MKTFDEIFRMACSGEKPQTANVVEFCAWSHLSWIYHRYQQGSISRDSAAMEKERLRIVYNDDAERYQRYVDCLGIFQDNIRRAGTLRAEINKETNPERKLEKALKCIALFTGVN